MPEAKTKQEKRKHKKGENKKKKKKKKVPAGVAGVKREPANPDDRGPHHRQELIVRSESLPPEAPEKKRKKKKGKKHTSYTCGFQGALEHRI